MTMQKSSNESDRGTASGSREPYSGPGDGRDGENRLHDVELSARGESLEDRQRDRASNGVPGGQDDSITTRKHQGDDDRYGVSRGD
ncbi:hypothetical protein [Lysobacter xanthus]